MAQSHDTYSAQAIHDGATAANKNKYQALAIQLVDPRWKCNLVICVGFVATLLSTAPTVAGLFNSILIERTGYALLALIGSSWSSCGGSTPRKSRRRSRLKEL